MKTRITQIIIGLITVLSFAQQQPQFTQYMFNTIAINPAYAGSREILVINMLNRNQWVGLNGAPVTQTLSVHSSIPGSKLGVGLSVINDRLAYERILDTGLGLYLNLYGTSAEDDVIGEPAPVAVVALAVSFHFSVDNI